MTECQHARTHQETVFVDLEEDNTLSYDIYEICDNPDCNKSWVIGEKSDNGEILANQMGLNTTHQTKGELQN